MPLTLQPKTITRAATLTSQQLTVLSPAQKECRRLAGVLGAYASSDSAGLCAATLGKDELFSLGKQRACGRVYAMFRGSRTGSDSPWRGEVRQAALNLQSSGGSAAAQELFACLPATIAPLTDVSASELSASLAELMPGVAPAPDTTPTELVAKPIVMGGGRYAPLAPAPTQEGGPLTVPTPGGVPAPCPEGTYRPNNLPTEPCVPIPAPPSQIDPAAQACLDQGGEWDPNCTTYPDCCMKWAPGPTPEQTGECEVLGVKCTYVAVGGVLVLAGGLALYFASKRKKR